MPNRIYWNDLSYEVQQDLIAEQVALLMEDTEVMAEVNEKLDEDNEIGEVKDETAQTRKWNIETELEQRAEDIINKTFYGSISINE